MEIQLKPCMQSSAKAYSDYKEKPQTLHAGLNQAKENVSNSEAIVRRATLPVTIIKPLPIKS